MERRKVQIALWVILFVMQVFLLAVLTFPLVMQSRIETEKIQSFDMSKIFGDRLSANGQLSVDEQRKLLALAKDYEQTILAHSKLEASMSNELRSLYGWLMIFLGIALVVQILLAVLSLRGPSPGRASGSE